MEATFVYQLKEIWSQRRCRLQVWVKSRRARPDQWRDQSIVGRKNDENDESAKNGSDDNNVKSIKYNRKYQKRINYHTDDDNDDKSVKSDDWPRVNVAGSQLLWRSWNKSRLQFFVLNICWYSKKF